MANSSSKSQAFLCPLILIMALASDPTPSSNHFQRIQGMSFQITKTGSKAVWFSDWKNLAFLPPVPQWGEKDTELRDLPTHYPSTSPRKLQTFLVPVSPMAISNLPGFATQSSWCLYGSFPEAIWLNKQVNENFGISRFWQDQDSRTCCTAVTVEFIQ